ncbi:MAG: TonB-dependent receptor, partial [Gemmatimonadales bacterium]
MIRADGPVGIADVELVLRPLGLTTRTDPRGFFLFPGIPDGPAELVARRPGFAPAVVSVQAGTPAASEVEIRLEPLAAMLDPIVSSATRDLRSLSAVAAAVSVADTSAIDRGRTVGLDVALRMMPGVQAASRYGTDEVNIGIRGSASRSRQAVRGVAILLDGIPLTEPDGAARLDLIELDAARQIEVVRGPASALYAGSPGGVVNVVSRTGRDSPGASLTTRFGGFGLRKVSGQFGGVFAGDRGSGFGSVSYSTLDGYRAHSDGDVLRGQAAFDYTTGRTRVALEGSGSRLDTRLPGPLTLREVDLDSRAAAPTAETFGFGRTDHRYRVGARLETAAGAGTATGYFFAGGRTLFFPIPNSIVDLDLYRLQGGGRLRSGQLAGLPLEGILGFDADNLWGDDHRWANTGGTRGSLLDDGWFRVPSLGGYSQL